LEIREAQKLAWDNKIAKGFNVVDVPLEFGLLTAEVGEAFTAWRKRLDDFGEELADIAIYLMAIAQMNGIDLDTEITRKIERTPPAPTNAIPTAHLSESVNNARRSAPPQDLPNGFMPAESDGRVRARDRAR